MKNAMRIFYCPFVGLMMIIASSGCAYEPSGGNISRNTNGAAIEGPYQATDFDESCSEAEKYAIFRAVKSSVDSYSYGQVQMKDTTVLEIGPDGNEQLERRATVDHKFFHYANARVHSWKVIDRFRNDLGECGITVSVMISRSPIATVDLK